MKIIGIIIIILCVLSITAFGPLLAGASLKEVLIVHLVSFILFGIIVTGAVLVICG